jgi:hypothetical protein
MHTLRVQKLKGKPGKYKLRKTFLLSEGLHRPQQKGKINVPF